MDQLARGAALSAPLAANLSEALDRSAAQLETGTPDEALAGGLEALAAALKEESPGDATAQMRRAALGETLGGIAAKLR